MKRNKVINRSAEQGLFAESKQKSRKLLKLPLLAVGGIFITSMVLATSGPETSISQPKVVDLPNLTAELQQLSSPTQTNISLLNQDTIDANEQQLIITDNNSIAPSPDDIVLIDQAQLEQMAIGAPAVTQPELAWEQITIKSGDNLSKIFPRVGLTAKDVYNITQSQGDIKALLSLKPGQELRFGFDLTATDKKALKQLELKLSQVKTLQIIHTKAGYLAETQTQEIEVRQKYALGHIKSSLFEAGLLAGISGNLIMKLAYIFGWDIDFALDLRQGDSFKLVYEENYINGNKFGDGNILAAEFTNKGKTFRAVRYTDENGLSRFYAPNGDSMRRAFSRTPVHFSRISSKFNPNRKHPVLKTNRPHRGVDYAAVTGTPILATSDGKVDFIGTKGGYGRTVVLSHGGKYTTLYAHMSRYKKGLKRGHRVKQGQTIGYIGSSGLATGSHLHYEFRVNGVHLDPLTVSLPKAEPLPKKHMIDFTEKVQPLLAQLNTLNETAVALNN